MIRPIGDVADPTAYYATRGLDPSRWSAGDGARFAPHRHARTKHLFVISGTISFNGEWLRPTAGVLIEAGTEHEAVAGPGGVTCIEAFEE